jgi:hypothetical protein
MKQENQEQQEIKLLIGTPAYNSVVYTDYLHSVLSFGSVTGLNVTVVTIGNESLITRARNKLFTLFENNNFDYLLFIDADIHFDIKEFVKLFKAQKDIIGSPVRLKSTDKVVLNFEASKPFKPEDYPIFEVDKIGSAAFMISQKVAKDMAQYCREHDDYYEHTDTCRSYPFPHAPNEQGRAVRIFPSPGHNRGNFGTGYFRLPELPCFCQRPAT